MHKDDAMLTQERKLDSALIQRLNKGLASFNHLQIQSRANQGQTEQNELAFNPDAYNHQSCDKYAMNEKFETTGFKALYKPKILSGFSPSMFNQSYWREHGAELCSSSGRGKVYRFKINETECILRHYRRGGLMRVFSSDSFFCLPNATSRAEKEYLLLEEMANRGLPVPRPIAFGVKRRLLFCKMDIIVEALTCSENLVEHLSRAELTTAQWQKVGQVIRQFHDEGIYHADLNAHNILICNQDEVYLLDFDKGELRGNLRSDPWKVANLSRLKRSLDKESGLHEHFFFKPENWQALYEAYQKGAC